MVLPVGLGHTHVQLAGGNGVQVIDGAAGAFHRAANAVLFPGFIDQAADSAAGGIIDPGHAAGSDGDKSLVRGLDWACTHKRTSPKTTAMLKISAFFIWNSPYLVIISFMPWIEQQWM